MKKRLMVCLLLLVFILSIAGCAAKKATQTEAVNFKVAVLNGPTAVGMIKMIDSQPALGDKVTAQYSVEPSPDTLNAKLVTGEIEIATVPTNMAALLYNKGVAYQLAAMNTWGVMYVLSNDPTIKNWTDLKGKNVDAAAKGSAADVVFRYLLSKNGVDPEKDLSIKYIASPVEQAQLAIAGRSNISVLPEPWVSTVLSQNKDMKLVLDLQKEWTRLNGTDVPFAQTCLVVKAEFASQHPEIVTKFLQEYASSIDWVNKNPGEAGPLLVKQGVNIPAAVAADAIPRCNLRYMGALDAKPAVEKYLQVLLDFSPNSIGGKLPDVNFYYQK